MRFTYVHMYKYMRVCTYITECSQLLTPIGVQYMWFPKRIAIAHFPFYHFCKIISPLSTPLLLPSFEDFLQALWHVQPQYAWAYRELGLSNHATKLANRAAAAAATNAKEYLHTHTHIFIYEHSALLALNPF